VQVPFWVGAVAVLVGAGVLAVRRRLARLRRRRGKLVVRPAVSPVTSFQTANRRVISVR
jgi:hypothetical protein